MPLATYADAFKEYARNAGAEKPDVEWILTPWDTWERNPRFTGKPGRHPEDDHEEGEQPRTDVRAAVAPGLYLDYEDDEIQY